MNGFVVALRLKKQQLGDDQTGDRVIDLYRRKRWRETNTTLVLPDLNLFDLKKNKKTIAPPMVNSVGGWKRRRCAAGYSQDPSHRWFALSAGENRCRMLVLHAPEGQSTMLESVEKAPTSPTDSLIHGFIYSSHTPVTACLMTISVILFHDLVHMFIAKLLYNIYYMWLLKNVCLFHPLLIITFRLSVEHQWALEHFNLCTDRLLHHYGDERTSPCGTLLDWSAVFHCQLSDLQNPLRDTQRTYGNVPVYTEQLHLLG